MIKNYIIAGLSIVILLLLVFLIPQSSSQKKTITEQALRLQKLDSLTNKYGETIYTQNSIISYNKEEISALTDSIFSLKKKDRKNTETIAYLQTRSRIVTRDILVPYKDSIGMKKFSDSISLLCKDVIEFMNDSTIRVPKKAYLSNDSLAISLTIKKEGINIDSLSIKDTMDIRFVEKKRFLRRPVIEVQYKHSNPLFQSEGARSVFYVPKKKSPLRHIVFIGAGILIGAMIK